MLAAPFSGSYPACCHPASGYSHADIPATETQSTTPSTTGQGQDVSPDSSVEHKTAVLAVKGLHATVPAPRRAALIPLSYYNQQCAPLLDSITELCISKAEHEVVAIGLQASLKKESVIISIAANNDVSPLTTAHLGKLWRYLQNISAISTTRGGLKEDNPSKSMNFMNEWPKMRMTTDDEDLVAVHVWDLTQYVYQFSCDKFVCCIKKK